ncbi:MAG: hypothetical protein ACXU9U_02360 [Parachlamydiaceae bacterium]
MLSPKKRVHIKLVNFFMLFLASTFLITFYWLLLVSLTYLGFPFPEIKIEKFYDLGFFSISTFGLIVFLTMVPFQTVETQLSPGFYSKIFNNPSAHFGLYVLMFSAIICFLIIAFQQAVDMGVYLSEMFIALIISIISAILFHRFWVLRYLYQPYVVYTYIKTLKWEETDEEIWFELFECTFKAIKQGRLSDAINFLDLLNRIYDKCAHTESSVGMREDLICLRKLAKECRPVASIIEKKWPFVSQKDVTTTLLE